MRTQGYIVSPRLACTTGDAVLRREREDREREGGQRDGGRTERGRETERVSRIWSQELRVWSPGSIWPAGFLLEGKRNHPWTLGL